MLKVEKLAEKNITGRSKVAFSIKGDKQAHFKNEIFVIVDDNRISDMDHTQTFTTIIFVSDNVSSDFANQIVGNAKLLPLLIGLNEPERTSTRKLRYLVKTNDKCEDLFEAEEKGEITEELFLEDIFEDDYLNDL